MHTTQMSSPKRANLVVAMQRAHHQQEMNKSLGKGISLSVEQFSPAPVVSPIFNREISFNVGSKKKKFATYSASRTGFSKPLNVFGTSAHIFKRVDRIVLNLQWVPSSTFNFSRYESTQRLYSQPASQLISSRKNANNTIDSEDGVVTSFRSLKLDNPREEETSHLNYYNGKDLPVPNPNDTLITGDNKKYTYNEALQLFYKSCKITGSRATSGSITRSNSPSRITNPKSKYPFSVTLTSNGNKRTFDSPLYDQFVPVSESIMPPIDYGMAGLIVTGAFPNSGVKSVQNKPDSARGQHRIFLSFDNRQKLFMWEITRILGRDFVILTGEPREFEEDLTDKTKKKLSACDAILICYSKAFDSCGNCFHEVTLAVDLGKPVVGVQLVEDEGIPEWLLQLLGMQRNSFIKVTATTLDMDVALIKEAVYEAVAPPESTWRQSFSP